MLGRTEASSRNASTPFAIGRLKAPNRVLLAPMSGITDAPFRRLAERLGAGPGGIGDDGERRGWSEGEREARGA